MKNIKQKLNVKQKCDMILTALLGEKYVETWWNSPNKAFNMQKPVDVPEIKVFNYLLNQMEPPH